MSRAGPPRAVLDADIIYSRVLHDLMGRVAGRLELLELVWSRELLAEAKQALVQRKGLAEDAAQRWIEHIPRNFPDGRIELDEASSTIDFGSLTTDPEDIHVCALAVASGANYLFTHDRGYLQDGLLHHGVEVLTPDEFLVPALDSDTQGVLELLELQASTWAGGRSIEELLDAIERAGALAFADKAGRSLGL